MYKIYLYWVISLMLISGEKNPLMESFVINFNAITIQEINVQDVQFIIAMNM